MAILSKDDILKHKDNKTITVSVPEWGGEVIISTMSGFARDRFESSILDAKGKMSTNNIRAKLVAACLVDEKGDLLFNNEKEVLELGKKSCVALDRVFVEAQKLNKILDDDIEELAKN